LTGYQLITEKRALAKSILKMLKEMGVGSLLHRANSCPQEKRTFEALISVWEANQLEQAQMLAEQQNKIACVNSHKQVIKHHLRSKNGLHWILAINARSL